jgi:Flp pilus assembly protein TadG
MIVRRLLRNRSASSAAEFALVLPLMILMLLGIIDAGRFAWEYNRAEKATAVGARVAVVTDIISSGIGTANYVGVGGLTAGDLIPASALGTVTCTRSSCTCSGTCPTGYATANATPFDYIVSQMTLMKGDIAAANVQVTYSGSGLGYAGDPNGMEISPLVTVSLTGLTFRPLILFGAASLTMPDFSTTLTAEDSVGSQSN